MKPYVLGDPRVTRDFSFAWRLAQERNPDTFGRMVYGRDVIIDGILSPWTTKNFVIDGEAYNSKAMILGNYVKGFMEYGEFHYNRVDLSMWAYPGTPWNPRGTNLFQIGNTENPVRIALPTVTEQDIHKLFWNLIEGVTLNNTVYHNGDPVQEWSVDLGIDNAALCFSRIVDHNDMRYDTYEYSTRFSLFTKVQTPRDNKAMFPNTVIPNNVEGH